MSRQLYAVGLFAAVMCVLAGCTPSDKKDSTSSSAPGDSVAGGSRSGEVHHQYRAVCLTKEAHGGNVSVLSRWLDTREKAEEFGKYHGDFKAKSHEWTIEMRIKPEHADTGHSPVQ